MSDGFNELRIYLLETLGKLEKGQERIEAKVDAIVADKGRADALIADTKEALEEHRASLESLQECIGKMEIPRRLDLILEVQGENAAKISKLRRAAINLDARVTLRDVPWPFPDLGWDDAKPEDDDDGSNGAGGHA